MPVANIIKKAERFDLKSCPDAFVVIRRMTYGEKMQRLELSGKMRILSNKKDPDAIGEINMMNKQISLWEFSNLILEHNLEYQEVEDGPIRPLNFRNSADVELLAARIGEEIGTLIDKLNNFEDEEETKN